MNCDEARACWHASTDGELTAKRAAGFDAHLNACADCRAFVRQMSALLGGLDDLRHASGQRACAAAPRRPTRLSRSWRYGSFAAAAAILLAVGLAPLVRRGETAVAPHAKRGAAAIVTKADAKVALTGRSSGHYLAVAQKTSQPHVHVVCLFPVVPRAAAAREEPMH